MCGVIIHHGGLDGAEGGALLLKPPLLLLRLPVGPGLDEFELDERPDPRLQDPAGRVNVLAGVMCVCVLGVGGGWAAGAAP